MSHPITDAEVTSLAEVIDTARVLIFTFDDAADAGDLPKRISEHLDRVMAFELACLETLAKTNPAVRASVAEHERANARVRLALGEALAANAGAERRGMERAAEIAESVSMGVKETETGWRVVGAAIDAIRATARGGK